MKAAKTRQPACRRIADKVDCESIAREHGNDPGNLYAVLRDGGVLPGPVAAAVAAQVGQRLEVLFEDHFQGSGRFTTMVHDFDGAWVGNRPPTTRRR